MNRHYAPPEEEYDESISFQYDNFGNRISKTGDTVQRYYTYNYGNKLTKVGTTPTTHFAQYTYNVDGVRCQKQVGNKITKYFLDGNKILKEVRTPSQQYSADSLKYLYDDDGLFMLVTNSDTYKYVRDQFNNVVLLLSQNYDTIARYEYDAHGKCTVYNAQNQVDTDPESIGNLNPFRWKSFYYDTESGLYYANGSYYDPQTGLYLDASPIESVLDNAFLPRGIDRNAPLCNNILELESNPFTMETTAKLAPDTSYDPTEGLPWWIRARNWIRQALYDVEMFFNKIPIGIRLLLGTFLLMLSIALTIETGGGGAEILELLVQAVIGVGLAAASYLVSGLFGNKLSWNGLANVVANAFLVTFAVLYISAFVNYLRYAIRENRLSILAEKYRQELLADNTVNQNMLRFATVAYDARFDKTFYAYNSEIVKMPIEMIHPTLREMNVRICCAEMQAANKALWSGSSLKNLYIYTVKVQTGAPAYACRVCSRVLFGKVATVYTGLFSGFGGKI